MMLSRNSQRSGVSTSFAPAYPYDAPSSSKAIIDACRPYDRLDSFPDVAELSKELEEKVRAKWGELL